MCLDWITDKPPQRRFSYSGNPIRVAALPPPRRKISKHLICDDSSYNRLVLRRYLNSINIEVDEAESGERALELVTSNGDYAIIWMDIRMGDEMSGVECTKRLREHMGYTGVVIALTGYVDESTYAECMKCDIQHFMSKPFDRDSVMMYSRRYVHRDNVVPSQRASIYVMETSGEPIARKGDTARRRHTFFSYVTPSKKCI